MFTSLLFTKHPEPEKAMALVPSAFQLNFCPFTSPVVLRMKVLKKTRGAIIITRGAIIIISIWSNLLTGYFIII